MPQRLWLRGRPRLCAQDAAYEPAAHATQEAAEEAPVVVEDVPWPQAVQLGEPDAAWYVPAKQGVQALPEPALGLKVPGAQATHVAAELAPVAVE